MFRWISVVMWVLTPGYGSSIRIAVSGYGESVNRPVMRPLVLGTLALVESVVVSVVVSVSGLWSSRIVAVLVSRWCECYVSFSGVVSSSNRLSGIIISLTVTGLSSGSGVRLC